MPGFMSHGFIPGSRAPLMMDVVAAAILLVLPLLALAIHLARHRRDYVRHKQVQLAVTTALAVVILGFEVEVRTHDWREAAAASPYYGSWLFPVFYVHLATAITATIAWVATVTMALKRFPRRPAPGPFSAAHRLMGRLAAALMGATAVTGWTFYYVAFLA
jgi:uncharacterized membrane protein YozB (DUF420 family)